jgi:hypothetical protein
VSRQDFDGGALFGRRLAAQQQAWQGHKHHNERNCVHERRSAAHLEQARANLQKKDNHQEVAEQQGLVNGIYGHGRD